MVGGGNFSCRHPKLWSYIKSNVKAFFVTGAITFVVSASATTILHSRQVRYKNDKSVEQAINELYEKAEQLGLILMDNNGNRYEQVEYLESTGTQYIDTDYKPNQDTRIIVDAKVEDFSQSSYWKGLFGSTFTNGRPSDPELYRFVLLLHPSGNFVIAYNDNAYQVNYDNKTNRHLYDLSKNGFKIDNQTLVTFSQVQFQTSINLNIFRDNNLKNQYARYIKMKLYSVKLYDDNTLVRDYTPVLDSNDAPCLFDKVSKTCFYNQGTGEFLYG